MRGLPYDPNKLKGLSPNKLRIGYYDSAAKRWKVLNNATVVNTNNHTLANTTKQLSYFTVLYPRSNYVTSPGNVAGASTQKAKQKYTIQRITPVPTPGKTK